MDLRNPVDCLQLLQRLRPVATAETQAILLEMLTTLPTSESPVAERLHVLEATRDTLHFVQGETVRRYPPQPLAPDSEENALLLQVVRLWQAMGSAYGHLGDQISPHDNASELWALTAQRQVQYAGHAILEYFRAHRALAPGLWSALHAAYLVSETRGVARHRVDDPLNAVWKAQSPSEAYVAILLVDLANPYGRSPRELVWISRWAQRFAPYCGMHMGNDESVAGNYGIDLGSDHGLRPLNLFSPSYALRRFDGSRVAGQIEAALNQFKRGVTPAALGLGDDCPVDAGARLLLWLYRPWGLASTGRKFQRRPSHGKARLTIPHEATVFFINGGPFHQPGAAQHHLHSLSSDIPLMTFGERVAGASDGSAVSAQAELRGLHAEPWEVLDQSVGGFRLRAQPGRNRPGHHQLVGLLPPDGDDFLLAHVSWLMYREDGVMEAGVQMLPGIPRTIGVRPLGHGVDHGYQPAFILPAIAALKAGPSLVLPGGWFKPSRTLRVYDGHEFEVRLGEVLLHGANFDQVSFEILPSG